MSRKSSGFNPFDLSYLDPRNMPRWEKKFLGLVFKTIKKFFVLSLKVSPTITALFFRRNFGIDYLSLNKLITANIVVWLFTIIPSTNSLNSYGDNYSSSPLSAFLALIVTILSIIHYQESYNNFQHGPVRDSQYSGDSWLVKYLNLDPTNTKLFVEPLIAIISGSLLVSLGSITGGLILVGGVALFLEERAFQQQLAGRFKRITNAQLRGAQFRNIRGQPYANWSKQAKQPAQQTTKKNYQNITKRVAVKIKKKP